jgi:hypothetical protein
MHFVVAEFDKLKEKKKPKSKSFSPVSKILFFFLEQKSKNKKKTNPKFGVFALLDIQKFLKKAGTKKKVGTFITSEKVDAASKTQKIESFEEFSFFLPPNCES